MASPQFSRVWVQPRATTRRRTRPLAPATVEADAARSSRRTGFIGPALDASGDQATSRGIDPMTARSRLKCVETPTGLGHFRAEITFGSIHNP